MAGAPRTTPSDSRGGARPTDLERVLTHHADIGLAALVVAIVAMMIVPLPPFVLDLLIALNIAVAVTLLLIAIYVSDALKIATFPTLLLLTTLFRLALEVSATRLILLEGHGGEVIAAFGDFVVAGNLVVGAVIFLILTLIQFIVISKGAERVAEVTARFTLDAMPGKQMAIDAELRAGHIDNAEARRRRASLARESQLFGSMDGAMKFVKGDAIAGIVILAVNVIGGLIVGVLQRGMTAAAAARTYTVLTIGEGLVAQIPALVVSTAAGIIVTRVASEEDGGHLGRDIGAQLLGHPKAIALTAGLLALLALVPGLPALPFLVMGTLLGTVAWNLMRAPRRALSPLDDGANGVAGNEGGDDAGRPGGIRATEPALPPPVLTPVAIQLSPTLAAMVAPPVGGIFVTQLLPAVRERLYAETGIPLPTVRVRADLPDSAGRAYVLRLNEIPLARGEVPPAPAGRDGAPDAGVVGRHLADHLLALMRRYGHEFIGIEETNALLDGLARTHPALVREVVPKLISPTLLTDVLRRLSEEGISLRNLRDILGAVAEWAPLEHDPVLLTEHVRAALRRAITFTHADARGVVPALLLDPMIEDAVRDAVHKTATGSYLALEPQLSRDIVAAVGRAVGDQPRPDGQQDDQTTPVILTTPDIRRYIRRLVEFDHPKVAVLSYQELAPEAQVQPLGRVRVGDGSS